jgi:hypothetical protein
MDITKIVNRFNRNNTFGHVESGDIFRKNIVFHEHGHQISSGEKFHDEVKIKRILKRVEQLYYPWGSGFSQNITLSPDVRQLHVLI